VIRTLTTGDEARLEEFLAGRADSSMFLRSNLRAAGIVDHGEPLQATYVGLFEGLAVAAVAAHCWNGMLLLQAPREVGALTHAAVAVSGRTVTGLGGPWTQVETASRALHLRGEELREVLYGLDLGAFEFELQRGLAGRRPRPDELEVLTDWREVYLLETRLAKEGPGLRSVARAGIALTHARGDDWVVERAGIPVGYTAFNARLPDMVQIGGVFTPGALRGQGVARAAVATHLLAARAQGARRAVLFTQETNHAARRAYEALGFRAVGDYGLLVP
jgi:RimJ/RimL family protein N-acetyltransferase